MQKEEGGAEFHEEKHEERMKRRTGTKDGNRGRDKGELQTMERGESQSLQDDKWKEEDLGRISAKTRWKRR